MRKRSEPNDYEENRDEYQTRPLTGLRYCINSASLRFIPVEKLEEEGYGEYLKLSEKEEKK